MEEMESMGKKQLLAEKLLRQREERNIMVSSFFPPSYWPHQKRAVDCKAWEEQPAGPALWGGGE